MIIDCNNNLFCFSFLSINFCFLLLVNLSTWRQFSTKEHGSDHATQSGHQGHHDEHGQHGKLSTQLLIIYLKEEEKNYQQLKKSKNQSWHYLTETLMRIIFQWISMLPFF